MKLNRFVALAMIALLAIGAMGVISTRSFAKAPAAQVQVPDVEDVSKGLDTDNIEEQVGEQVQDGLPDAAEAPGAEDTGPDEQTPSYAGSIAVDQTATEGMSEVDESAARLGRPLLPVTKRQPRR